MLITGTVLKVVPRGWYFYDFLSGTVGQFPFRFRSKTQKGQIRSMLYARHKFVVTFIYTKLHLIWLIRLRLGKSRINIRIVLVILRAEICDCL